MSVLALDRFGNPASDAVVGIGLSSGTLTSGTQTATSQANGLAVFSDLVMDTAGTYTLKATLAGATSVTSRPFMIRPGPPASSRSRPSRATARPAAG